MFFTARDLFTIADGDITRAIARARQSAAPSPCPLVTQGHEPSSFVMSARRTARCAAQSRYFGARLGGSPSRSPIAAPSADFRGAGLVRGRTRAGFDASI